jgi:hypothetical protein
MTLTTERPQTLTPLIPEINDPVTPMKLSEALRLGSMVTKQGFYTFESDLDGSRCALGTIEFAQPGTISPDSNFTQKPLGPQVGRTCSVGCDTSGLPKHWGLAGQIVHLNDHHKWPRNKIADWLESVGF